MSLPSLDDEMATVGLVTGGHLLSHFYLLTLPPLFPLLRSDFALSNAELGLLAAVISVAMLLQIVVGGVVDRIGAKRVFVAGVGVTSLGILLAGLADSYLALLAFAAVSGLGQTAFHPADYPLLEVVSDPDRLGRNFSVHTFGGYVGFAAAPLVVGTLAAVYSWRTALLVVGAVGVVYAVFAALTLQPVVSQSTDETDQAETGRSLSIFRPVILTMSAFFVLFSMASKGIQTFTPILAIDSFHLTDAVGNTALSGFFAVAAVTILLGGFFADRYDPRHVIAASATTAAAVMFVAISGVLPVGRMALIVLFGFAGGAYGTVFASRDRLVSTASPTGSTGKSFGFVFTASSLGSLVSPILLGAVIDATTTTLAFVLVGGFFLLSGAVVLAIGNWPTSVTARFSSRSG